MASCLIIVVAGIQWLCVPFIFPILVEFLDSADPGARRAHPTTWPQRSWRGATTRRWTPGPRFCSVQLEKTGKKPRTLKRWEPQEDQSCNQKGGVTRRPKVEPKTGNQRRVVCMCFCCWHFRNWPWVLIFPSHCRMFFATKCDSVLGARQLQNTRPWPSAALCGIEQVFSVAWPFVSLVDLEWFGMVWGMNPWFLRANATVNRGKLSRRGASG